MDTTSMLAETGAIPAIARELGIDETTAEAGAGALLPAVLTAFHQPVAGGGGAGGLGALIGALGGMGGGGLLDNAAGPEATDTGKGNEILGHIFGSKDTSRAVAADAATQSGVDPALLKKMLPILAMIVGGYVMKRSAGGTAGAAAGGGGGLGGALGSVLGGATGGGGLLGQIIGAAGQILASRR
ncbi:DUF937 domain-containing protein [Parablastomonas sp. CN1-191]|uniref:DUF937 domain-containing protein n=1 Tax=Parablastomonas sp. CN1-191 TaxID=3400908 RepID=UPI003BF87655